MRAMDDSPFDPIAKTFINNIEAIRTLADEIARLADEHDRQRTQESMLSMMRVLGVDEEKLTELAATVPSPSIEGDIVSEHDDDIAEMLKVLLMYMTEKEPEKFAEMERLMLASQRGGARQGQLLRRGAVTLLVSFFETLIADLVQVYYLRFPESIPADSGTFTLAELRRLGSIADAEKHIASKEAEKLLRDSLDGQLKFFASKFKLAVDTLRGYSVMLEVTQRRNIIVHNDAIVNRIYLQSVPKPFLAGHPLKEGDRLQNSSSYLRASIDGALILGYELLQHCWRKWGKAAVDAEEFSVHLSYRLLKDGRPDLAEQIANITEQFDAGSDQGRRSVIVNHAIAMRDTGRDDEMLRLLESIDWSAAALSFRVVVAALRGDVDTIKKLGPRALTSGELKKHDLARWPAFSKIRAEPIYAELMQTPVPESPTD
jgi:hypothetical protein